MSSFRHHEEEEEQQEQKGKELDALETQVKRIIATLEKYGMQLQPAPVAQPENQMQGDPHGESY